MTRSSPTNNMVMARMLSSFKQSLREALSDFSSTPLKLKSDIGEQVEKVIKNQPTKDDFDQLIEAVKAIRPATLNVSNGADKLAVDGMYGEDVLDGLVNITDNLKKIPDAVRESASQIVKSVSGIKLDIPDVQEVAGRVEISNKPEVSVPQLQQVVNQLAGIKGEIKSAMGREISIPDSFKINNLADLKTYIGEANKELLTKVAEAVDGISSAVSSLPKVEFPDSISVNNFPPQKIPQPVTNININPLRGFVKTTAATVTTSLTPLPTYGVLDNRRAIQVYNADSSLTLYIGGSDVNTTNGFPVPPLSFSPALDLGVRMILYGVTSSGSINVRILELSNEEVGG